MTPDSLGVPNGDLSLRLVSSGSLPGPSAPSASTAGVIHPSEQSPPATIAALSDGPQRTAKSFSETEEAEPGIWDKIKKAWSNWKAEIRAEPGVELMTKPGETASRNEKAAYWGIRIAAAAGAVVTFLAAKAAAGFGALLMAGAAATVVIPVALAVVSACRGEGAVAGITKLYHWSFIPANKLSELCGKCVAHAAQDNEAGKKAEMISKVFDKIAAIAAVMASGKGVAAPIIGAVGAAAGAAAAAFVNAMPAIFAGICVVGGGMYNCLRLCAPCSLPVGPVLTSLSSLSTASPYQRLENTFDGALKVEYYKPHISVPNIKFGSSGTNLPIDQRTAADYKSYIERVIEKNDEKGLNGALLQVIRDLSFKAEKNEIIWVNKVLNTVVDTLIAGNRIDAAHKLIDEFGNKETLFIVLGAKKDLTDEDVQEDLNERLPKIISATQSILKEASVKLT